MVLKQKNQAAQDLGTNATNRAAHDPAAETRIKKHKISVLKQQRKQHEFLVLKQDLRITRSLYQEENEATEDFPQNTKFSSRNRMNPG